MIKEIANPEVDGPVLYERVQVAFAQPTLGFVLGRLA